MNTIKPNKKRAISGNGNGSRKRGNGRPSTVTNSKVAPALKRSQNDFTSRVVAAEPQVLKFQIRADRLETKPASVSPWVNPTQFERPAFLMNYPFSYATDAANNQWMKDLKDDQRQPDHVRAAVQFLNLYQNIAAEGLVYLLPTPQGMDLQDLVYTANLGIVLGHLPDQNTVVISNFTSAPRRGETEVGVRFFR